MNIKKYSLTTLLLMLLLSFGYSQNGVLKGLITDKETKEPLIGATIKADENLGTATDYNGAFEWSLPAGNYELTISYIGYKPQSKNVTIRNSEVTEIEISLSPDVAILETATVTSGKFEKPLGEVTVSLEVMKPELIESTSKSTLDAVLEKIPGVTIIDGQANIRGGSGYSQGAGSRVLLLMDDVPILQADAGFPNWDDIPVENIGQVEVVKGAASALYGSSALNGIINVRTAYAKSEPETKVATYYTSYLAPTDKRLQWWAQPEKTDTLSKWRQHPQEIAASFSHKQKFGKTDFVFGSFYRNLSSYRKDTYNEYGRANISLKHRVNDQLTLGFNTNFNTGKSGSFIYWKSDTLAYEGRESTISHRSRIRYNIDPSITYYDNGSNRHRLTGRYYHVKNNNDSNQGTSSDLFYAEYQFQRKFEQQNLVTSFGLVGSGTSIDAELYGDTTFTSRNMAAYIQLDKKFFNRLNVSLGARYEYNVLRNPGFEYAQGVVKPSDEKESLPVFRLGLNYRIGKATYLRSSIGQGYRFPTVAEKYIFTDVGGFFIVPNPTLTSETGWSGELGIKQGFRISSFEGFIDLSAFVMEYQNMMEFSFVGTAFQAINIGDTSIKGLEATVAGKGKIGKIEVETLMGFTTIDPRFLTFDATPIQPGTEPTVGQINANNSSSETNILKYRSKNTFKLDIQAKYKKLTLGLEGLRNSRVEAIDKIFNIIVPQLQQFREDHKNGYSVWTARASYQFNSHFKTSVLFGNITNEVYSKRPGLLEAPRSITVRVDYAF